MPSVFTFSNSDSELLEELLQVLGSNSGSFREQWSIQAEAVVEPVGWDALWKLSKEFCQKLGVRFPCVAYVSVLGVEFESLSASLEVRGVQHEKVQLPSRRADVPLVELWPTRQQSEPCIDAHSTAEFIHLLRFYYNNVWMPWDDMDESVILDATLKERMKLWSGMHDGTIPMHIARRITLLRNEAIATYHKIREAEESVDPEDLNNEDDSMLPDNYMSRCAVMHARLDYLQSKWTTFENPLIRASYLAEQENKVNAEHHRSVSILWKGGSVRELKQLTEEVERLIGAEQRVSVCWSAEEALASEPAQLLVCSQRLQVPDIALADILIRGIRGSMLMSTEVRSCLLVVTEDSELHELTLHCKQVNTAVLVRGGTLRVRGCRFTDDSDSCQSDFVQGAVVMAGGRLLLENCTLDNLYSGLVVHAGAQVELRDCKLEGCGVGIQMFSGADVRLSGTNISGCAEHCIRYELDLPDGEKKHVAISSLEGLSISPCCKIGSGSESDICVVQQESALD